ncbi:hypothetical protein SG34_021445 [Thalassomonas viridans]|uniref:Sulphotransferase Stf0 domain-containing protein n=1 Tax=Thalassomonas viridans TaxID=137584 RepID=A0AAF0C7P6_9GAMM|nr:Stf0 family sulfotransferase [Thalassomonas viridans]WDE03913.1 hypothetical protein SG34_021445 [Thalassomonas viridans]
MKTTDEQLLELMQELDKRDTLPLDSVNKKLLVLSTPRSGSSMFCDVLSQTGLIGDCREWFNFRYLEAYIKTTGSQQVNFYEYIDYVIGKTTAGTGIFAVNVHIDQYTTLLKNKVNILDLGFDHIVYLRRKDIYAQTVSLAKADLLDAWSAGTPKKALGEQLSNSTLLPYFSQLRGYERYYQQKLAGKVQAEYEYEDFSRLDQPSAYLQVLAALGFDGFSGSFHTGMKKQADADSAKIIADFRKYISG